MQTLGSLGLTTRGRIAAWTARYCAQFDRADIRADDLERFEAELQPGELGPVRFARLTCTGSAIDRSAVADPTAPHSYTLIVQLAGSGTLSQYGQFSQMQPGDLALCDNAAPHAHHMAERSELILLSVPAHVLRQHLPTPEQFCGLRLAATTGTTSVAASLVANLCRRARSELAAPMQERLARQLMEMISISYAVAFDTLIAPSSVVGGRYAKARRFIEQNLRDPDLGPQKIARALNVSSRYLRMIFAGEQESVSSYILRRRLEEVAQQLMDPRWRGRSICEIAFGWGFNSAPHFSRSFRERFGMSPRQYRTREQEAGCEHAPLAANG